MNQETILCIPGPWADRGAFVKAVASLEPMGEFMFAGSVLAHITEKDHVAVEFYGPTPQTRESFEIAGQGKLAEETLTSIAAHSGVVYLHFPIDVIGQRDRILKFTNVIREAGGFAVQVESSGIAHDWGRWLELLSGDEYDVYCCFVSLIGDENEFYSCGMHHFDLPECSVPQSVDVGEAAALMNQFNMYQITDRPTFADGHTFGLEPGAPIFVLNHQADPRHAPEHLFYNNHGVWQMVPAT